MTSILPMLRKAEPNICSRIEARRSTFTSRCYRQKYNFFDLSGSISSPLCIPIYRKHVLVLRLVRELLCNHEKRTICDQMCKHNRPEALAVNSRLLNRQQYFLSIRVVDSRNGVFATRQCKKDSQ